MQKAVKQKNFQINNSSKAFKILSSQLYSNKSLAIVRELSCNAFDSHVSVQQTKPFEVFLNGSLKELTIEDFGSGLTHEEVMGVYSNFLDSDKAENADLIGGLGLGSKSPFAYTDRFTIRAIKKGISNYYLAYMNNGYPVIYHLSTKKTKKRNGVKITIHVDNEHDLDDFKESINLALKYFPPAAYKVSPYASVVPVAWDIVPNGLFGVSNEYRANTGIVMNNVFYNIDKRQLPKSFFETHKNMLDVTSLILFTEDNSLEVTASRESLSYDKESLKVLGKILTELSDKIIVKIQESFALEKSYYNAQCKYKKQNYSIDRMLRGHKIYWNNKQITPYIDVISVLQNKKVFTILKSNDLNLQNIRFNWVSALHENVGIFYSKNPVIVFKGDSNKPLNKILNFNKDDIKPGTIVCRGDILDLTILCNVFDIDISVQGYLNTSGVVKLENMATEPKPVKVSTITGKSVSRLKKAEEILPYKVTYKYPSYSVSDIAYSNLIYKDIDPVNAAYLETINNDIKNKLALSRIQALEFFYASDFIKTTLKKPEKIILIPASHKTVINSNTIPHANDFYRNLEAELINTTNFSRMTGLKNTLKNKYFEQLSILIDQDKLAEEHLLSLKPYLISDHYNLLNFINQFYPTLARIKNITYDDTIIKLKQFDKEIEDLFASFCIKYPDIISVARSSDYTKVSIIDFTDYIMLKSKQ